MIHPLAWLMWVATASASILLTRNPLYVTVLLGVAYLVLDAVRSWSYNAPLSEGGSAPAGRRLPVSPWQFALFAIPAGALFNGLTSHVGETVLLRLPPGLPLVGGAITAEALVFGAINGLVLSALFTTFAVLNLAVPIRDLIGYLPRAFYPVAVVSAIAVTFVPNTLRQVRQVREAQAVRGHRMRGLRDWLPLFMPVLVGGLERALQLAEAMTARGFAGTGVTSQRSRRRTITQLTLAGGLVAVLASGVLRLMVGGGQLSTGLLVVGLGLVVAAIWYTGRGVQRTRYRRPRWHGTDIAMTVGGMVALSSLLIWGGTRDYSPYPALAWPPFDLKVGFGLLGLLAPALVVARAAEPPAAAVRPSMREDRNV
jgi:energy-coupling factor transport system permease protein